jgi:hypothetical protein
MAHVPLGSKSLPFRGTPHNSSIRGVVQIILAMRAAQKQLRAFHINVNPVAGYIRNM